MTDRIRVRCIDRTVFDVDAETLKPLNSGRYDPWAFTDPETVPTIEHDEWVRRLQVARDASKSNDEIDDLEEAFGLDPL